jgi:hypothetical protein
LRIKKTKAWAKVSFLSFAFDAVGLMDRLSPRKMAWKYEETVKGSIESQIVLSGLLIIDTNLF